MKIAVIGSGISGLAAAYFLSKKYEVWLFEKNDYLGGHAHTVTIEDNFGQHKIDTGFIVCNKKTYPNFINLLTTLKVELQKSQMSFSVKDPENGLEFSGKNFNTIFSQRKNICKLDFWKMLVDINRFNFYAKKSLKEHENITLNEFLNEYSFGSYARKYFIQPLIASIWSTSAAAALDFPTNFLFQFLDNHGLLSLNGAPQWYTIKRGSIEYVEALRKLATAKVLLNTTVNKVQRIQDKVKINATSVEFIFDKVVFATHSDQVLDMLDNPTVLEQEVFNNMKYEESSVVLHTDTSVLPNQKRAWASWNYFVNDAPHPNLTYNMNILQNIQSNTTYCISLNLDNYIDQQYVIDKYNYAHPTYNQKLLDAAASWREINTKNIFYAGAYWGYGFHEDGINSAIRVVNKIDKDILCNTPYIQDL